MTENELQKRKERAEKETLIISRTDEGFRVYSPDRPTNSYTVSGSPEEPACTCPDFQHHEGDLQWRCKHILAVLNQFEREKTASDPKDPYEAKERRAIQDEGRLPEKPEKKEPKTRSNGAPQMVIKRSISPDGRIDSLSVEFSCPVGRGSPEEIKKRAEDTLKLQSEIVESFLNGNGGKRKQPEAKTEVADGSVSAHLLNIGGMPGKWGRRLYINVQVNGQTSKLFGTKKELADRIMGAGFSEQLALIEEGRQLNLSCRVITKPSQDGRFINIERVLPIQPLQPKKGRG